MSGAVCRKSKHLAPAGARPKDGVITNRRSALSIKISSSGMCQRNLIF